MSQAAAVLPSLLEQPWARALGWALIYSLLQGAIVMALVAGSLALLRRASPQARYALACGGLLIMLLLPAATWWSLYREESRPAPVLTGVTASTPEPAPIEHSSAVNPPVPPVGVDHQELLRFTSSAWKVEETTPVLVAVWLIGVAALALWRTSGLVYAVWLCRRGTRQVPSAWQARLARLRHRLRIGRPVVLLESLQVRVPVAIGWLRPVILMPVGLLSGLSLPQLDAILAHELIHVRRWDYLVNLLQTTVENLLFYHPAVWWISHRIRVEREYCCDDAAVACCNCARTYAEALANLEAWAGAWPRLGMAADGGSLLDRVRRQFVPRSVSRTGGWGLVLALPALILMATLLGLPGPGYGGARDRGEIAWYTFDSTGAVAGPALRVRGAVPAPDRFGAIDAAYRFDGGNAVVEMEEPVQGDFLTIAFWAKSEVPIRADNPRGCTLFGTCDGSSDAGGVTFGPHTSGLDNEVISLLWEGGYKAYYWTSATLPQGIDTSWHHYAFIWDDAEGAYSLSLDGQAMGAADVVLWNNCVTLPSATSPVPTWLSNRQWQFGQDRRQTEDGWRGSLDGLRVWNRSLTASEVAALYRARDGEEIEPLRQLPPGAGGINVEHGAGLEIPHGGLSVTSDEREDGTVPKATSQEVMTLLNSSPRTTHYDLSVTGHDFAIEPRECDLMSRQRQVLRLSEPANYRDGRRVYLTAEQTSGPFAPEASRTDTITTYAGTVVYTSFQERGVKYAILTAVRDTPQAVAVRAYVKGTAVALGERERTGSQDAD